MTVVIVAMLVLLTVSILQEKMDVLEALKKQNLVFRWVLIYALLLAVVIFGMYGLGMILPHLSMRSFKGRRGR